MTEDLERRLGIYWKRRYGKARPRDGKDYFDTYEGWRSRGRQVRKGASGLSHTLPWEPRQYPFYETFSLTKPKPTCSNHNSSET